MNDKNKQRSRAIARWKKDNDPAVEFDEPDEELEANAERYLMNLNNVD